MASLNQSLSSMAAESTDSPLSNLTQNSSGVATTASSPGLDMAMNVVFGTLAALILVAMGCAVDIDVMIQHVKRPYGIGVGVMSQFGVMPLVAFLLCLAFKLDPAHAMSVLVVGCCPGGSVSNVLAYLVDGDMSLSICMTTASTALAMGLMPLCLWLYSQPWTTPAFVIPYWKIAVTLVLIVVPVGLGVLLKYKSPKGALLFLKIGGFFGFFILIVAAVLGGLTYKNMWVGPPSIFIMAVVFPLIGYVFGYVIAWLFRMDSKCRKTVCIETGNQNIGLALSILKLTFPAEITGELLLFPLMYGVFQGIEAVIIITTYQIWKIKCRKPEENDEKEPDSDPTTLLLQKLMKRPN
ncbi:solute carrier family 10 member 6-like [Branchiostoma floridae]|uniref:Solute carrier family 10 member 6-like n=1 Tax=Branchiostoma floridae TaxID=7739 RepID=A0A9J7M294_BRAFL|nr:solute carrier family 10 member 6-like [Branchiostoma floridae]